MNIEELRLEINKVQDFLLIDRLPTISELRSNDLKRVESLINKFGGLKKVSEILDVPLKNKYRKCLKRMY